MTTPHYSEYLNSEQWKLVQEGAKQRAAYRCQVCNSPDSLQVHHRTYERFGNELPEDLTVLCEDCHTLFHESKSNATITTMFEALNETYVKIDQVMGRRDPNATSGIATGFTDLDQLTSGFHKSELTVLAARASVGKTAMLLNFVRHIVMNEKLPVLFFSLAETRIELSQRLLAAQARVDSLRLLKGLLSTDDLGRIHTAGDLLRDAPLYIDDSPRQHLPHVVATLGRMVRERNVCVAFLDSIDLIEPPNSRGFRPEQVAAIARRLKVLARELKVPIVATANLGRSAEDRLDHRPRLADLRESASVEQYADTCLMLHRPGLYARDQEDRTLEVIIAKQRNGPTGEITLTYLKQYMLFENYAGEPFGVE